MTSSFIHSFEGNVSVFNNSPRYHPYHSVQNQNFPPERFPVHSRSMSQDMGSPQSNHTNSQWWNACGPYQRFGDSVNTFSPRSSSSGSGIQRASPGYTFRDNRNRISPYQESRSPWNGSPIGRVHPERSPVLLMSHNTSTHDDWRMRRPQINHTNSHWDQHSPQPLAYGYHPSPKARTHRNPKRGLQYGTKSVPKGKGEVWRKSLHSCSVNSELNTTSQPHPLAPLATSTPRDLESDGDVNVVDDDDTCKSSKTASTSILDNSREEEKR